MKKILLVVFLIFIFISEVKAENWKKLPKDDLYYDIESVRPESSNTVSLFIKKESDNDLEYRSRYIINCQTQSISSVERILYNKTLQKSLYHEDIERIWINIPENSIMKILYDCICPFFLTPKI